MRFGHEHDVPISVADWHDHALNTCTRLRRGIPWRGSAEPVFESVYEVAWFAAYEPAADAILADLESEYIRLEAASNERMRDLRARTRVETDWDPYFEGEMTASELAEQSFEETTSASDEFIAGLRAQVEWHQAELDAIHAATDRKVQAAAAAATEIATAAARDSMELLAAGVESYCSSDVP